MLHNIKIAFEIAVLFGMYFFVFLVVMEIQINEPTQKNGLK